MRKFKLFFTILTAVLFASCQTEGLDSDLLNNENEVPAGNSLFMFNYGDHTLVAPMANAAFGNNFITILGRWGAGESADGNIHIYMPITATTGTYSGDEITIGYRPPLAELPYLNVDWSGQKNGTVTITSIDTQNHTISGTFSFTGYWYIEDTNHPPVNFSNGVFKNIPYYGSVPGQAPVEDPVYLKATVNGTAKDYSNIIATTVGASTNIGGSIVSPMSNIKVVIPNSNFIVGTHALGNNPSDGPTAIVSNGTNIGFRSISGSLTIISLANNRIKGTFNFVAANPENTSQTIQVTAGSFETEWP